MIIMTLKSYDFEVIIAVGVVYLPKQTFYNLPYEKRQIIEQAALDEFAKYGFDGSNMNRIVSGAKIAKGSFYQYFDDKKDVFFHLIDTLVSQKVKILEPFFISIHEKSFTDNFRDIMKAGLDFADSNPKYYMIGEDFAKKQSYFIEEFVTKYNPMAVDIYMQLLEQAQKDGELYEGINLTMTASFISSLVNSVTLNIISNSMTKQQRDTVIMELIDFIRRAVLKDIV